MGYWLFMLAVSLLIPGTMICAGYFMARHTPKEINAIVGYRTSMSMKNTDTWNFAHHIAGRFWIKWGKITLLPSAIPMLALYGQRTEVVGMVGFVLAMLQLIPLLAVVPVTERALRRAFDQDGKRKG